MISARAIVLGNFNQRESALSRLSEVAMAFRLNGNFTIFVLFFGVSLIEAFQTRNWLKALFWLAIGIFFLVADNTNFIAWRRRR